jgi:hypothetical protein
VPASPLRGLQRQDAPVGRVVVDDEQTLVLQLGLGADELAPPARRQLRDRRLDA